VVDRGENAVVQQESMDEVLGVAVGAHHLALVVDAEDLGFQGTRGAGDVDRGEDAVLEQEPMGEASGSPSSGIDVGAHHLAAVVETEDGGQHGAGNANVV
jgi:hypothetical protein